MNQQGSAIAALLPFVFMFAIFYFLLIRPQQIQQKKRKEMLANLRKGNQVITVGGIYGEIVDVKDDALMLKIADKVTIRTTRAAVGTVLGKEN
ncbi:MAG TPA: preprotein translocase subunit YajC [Firmicutes bacterium]|nr:preprotein translocase subunit YajC [Bacillota bacterium]